MYHLDDLTAWVYLSTFLVAVYGAGLFFWWWIKKGQASAVFAYVAFVFVGEIFEVSYALYARYLLLFGGEMEYVEFLKSFLWPYRKVVTLVAFTCIVVHMSWRAFGNRVFKRRTGDTK